MIAICPNPYRDLGLSYTSTVISFLESKGYPVCVCPAFGGEDDGVLPTGLNYRVLSEVAEECSLAVVIGGDGTILSVTRTLTGYNIPVFGINMGTMGFLCCTAPGDEDCFDLLLSAAAGTCYSSVRMMLDLKLLRDNQCIVTDTALNDLVVHGYGDCITVDIYINGSLINSFNGDGIVVSTPTGSTGYSMSAGGPIVEPAASNLIVTPICAHSLSARSYVFSDSDEVKLEVRKEHNRRAYISSDGNNISDINNNDILIISKSKHSTVLLDSDHLSFFRKISEKLS